MEVYFFTQARADYIIPDGACRCYNRTGTASAIALSSLFADYANLISSSDNTYRHYTGVSPSNLVE